ncbi:MAG TPA: adenylate/guanylate cyclase domain-containing protein [Candidatus Acidoferrales bacterium]|nr:adenylate/guanylate cyclase domain-containing protein [Candidatus Acidoferrales bacterium]
MCCSACGHENRADAKFCLGCGTKLVLKCHSCGRELPQDARFCDACGHPVETAPAATAADPRSYTPHHLADKILTGRSALEGERKQVTVLFADVAGSTALAERLDPEEMHGIMDRCFGFLMEEVHRYEGTVNQFTGDGIMALFGAPIAHEDAPERAIRAALGMQASLQRYGEELQRQRGIEFKMRIGINTGPVVVGRIGDDLRMDYTAVGDTTNLAARLQSAAAPGAIVISEHTAKLVAGRFVTQVLGQLTLKGKSQPVTAYEIVRALPRTPLVAPSEHGLTPLISRTAELAALERIFEHARNGRGQVAFVVGDAGIGKSRLLHEFRRRVGAADVTWLEGRCISFGRGIPFLPIIDVLKGGFAIEEADDEPAIIEKIRQGLDGLGAEIQAAEPYLRALLAVDPGDAAVAGMDAGARRFATFDALKRLMLGSAAQQPLVVLIEDLHWIDPASEEYLTYIVDAVAGARVLLLCTFRPGYRPALGDRSYFNRVALQPLSADEAAALAAAMLEAPEFPAEIRALIASKAEGNPFFIEEITKSLMEIGALRRTAEGYTLGRPVSEIVIPNTIQDVIMARIDRLGDEPKRAMQIASVIGREFAVRLLQRASQLGDSVNALVGELRALELIYEKAGVPELAYMFKHALTHDVAYESLLVQRRKQLHRTIGLAIEELYADRLAEYWETLAHHFYRAEDWPRAFAYLVKAGDKARAAFANGEAVYFYDRALEAATHLDVAPQRHAAIYESKGRVHFCRSEFPEAIDAYRRAFTEVSADADRARLNAALSQALLWAHEFDSATATATEALAAARSTGQSAVAAGAQFVVGFVQMVRGQLEGATRCYADAETLARAAGQPVLGSHIELYDVIKLNWRGEYRTAIQRLEPVLTTFREENQLLHFVEACSTFTMTLGGAGEYARALALLTEGVALSESIGDKVWRARMWNTRGWILGEFGVDEAADEANRRCVEIARQLGPLRIASELIGNAEANLADVALARGDLAGAEPHLAAVAAILGDRRNEWMTWRYGMHYRLCAAELMLQRGDLARTRQHIEACLATARRTQSRRYLVRATRLLAACHVAGGERTEADRLLAVTVDEARTLGNPPQLWHALLAHGRVLQSLGRDDQAIAAWREAARVVASVAAAVPDELRTALVHSPLGATLLELGA